MTLYFNNAVSQAGNIVGNWWQDSGCSVAAEGLPTDGDDLVIVAGATLQTWGLGAVQPFSLTVYGINRSDLSALSCVLLFEGAPAENWGPVSSAVFEDSATNQDTGSCSQATFCTRAGSCDNNGTVTVGIFNYDAVNSAGATCGTGTFNGSAVNYGQVTGGTFNDTSSNEGSVTNGTFAPTARNNGTVTNATSFPALNVGTITNIASSGFSGSNNGTITNLTWDGSFPGTNNGTVVNLLVSASFSGGNWIVAGSLISIGGTITNIVTTNIGVVPSAADVRAGTSVGVSPAVGTLVVPAAVTDGQPILLAAEDAMVKYLTACALGATIVSSVNGETDDLEPPLIGVTAEDAAESRASPIGNRYLDITVEVITPLEAVIQGGDPLTPAARRSLIVGVDQSLRNDHLAELLTTAGVFSVDGVTFLGERQQVSGRRHGYAFAYRLACRLS